MTTTLTTRVPFYIILTCTIMINCSSFSFRKTFKTPRENYESRVAELDKQEILERSSFGSDEDDEDEHRHTASTSAKDGPGPGPGPVSVATAQINLRFGEERTNNVKHILVPIVVPYPCFPYHLVQPMISGRSAFGIDQHNLLNSQDVWDTKKVRRCRKRTVKKTYPEADEVPHVYFFNKSHTCNGKPDVDAVKNQPISELSETELELIEGLEDGFGGEVPESTTQTPEVQNEGATSTTEPEDSSKNTELGNSSTTNAPQTCNGTLDEIFQNPSNPCGTPGLLKLILAKEDDTYSVCNCCCCCCQNSGGTNYPESIELTPLTQHLCGTNEEPSNSINSSKNGANLSSICLNSTDQNGEGSSKSGSKCGCLLPPCWCAKNQVPSSVDGLQNGFDGNYFSRGILCGIADSD